MTDQPTLLEFPCSFPIKAMGKNTSEFSAMVRFVVAKHTIGQNGIVFEEKLSSGDKFISVTATIIAESKSQLDAIYQELKDSKQVLMLL